MSSLILESNFDGVQSFTESVGEGQEKNWYIEGPFLQADVVNRNRRFYPGSIMEKSVKNYDEQYIKTRRALGEMDHPSNRSSIDMMRATHLTESVNKDGNSYIGKARVLDTDVGRNVQAILKGGGQIGVSSRGRGTLKEGTKGVSVVQEGYMIDAIDIVFSPSAPDAFVNGIMENDQAIMSTITEDAEFTEYMREEMHRAKRKDLPKTKQNLFEGFMKRLEKRYQN